MPEMERLTPDKWTQLRHIRLEALRDSPGMFLSTYETEHAFRRADWLSEFRRGEWYVGRLEGRLVCMMGVTKACERDTEDGDWEQRYYIEYMWVSQDIRRNGVARHMLEDVLDRLRDPRARRKPEVKAVHLWVLDGNDAAVGLYKRSGFHSTGLWHPLEAKPGRTEHQMCKDFEVIPSWRRKVPVRQLVNV